MRPSEEAEEEYFEAIVCYKTAKTYLDTARRTSKSKGLIQDLLQAFRQFDERTDELHGEFWMDWEKEVDGSFSDWHRDVWVRADEEAARRLQGHPLPPPPSFMTVEIT